MSSRNAALADAVAAAINDAPDDTFGLDFGEAARVWMILLNEEGLGDGARVEVAPKTFTQEPRAKGHVTHRTFQIDIGVRRRVGVGEGGELDNAAIDAVAGLVERLADFFRVGDDLGDTGASLRRVEPSDPVIDNNSLYTFGVALGVLTLTFEQTT